MKTFGEALKELRTSAKLTQEQLAQKCGMTKQSISRYEKSDREPNIRTAKIIADALGTPLSALVPVEAVVATTAQQQREALFLELLRQLSPEQQEMILAQLQGAVHIPKGQGFL